MIDRESAGKSRHSKKAAASKKNYEEPIGISKKTIVSGVILVLIAVLCAVYVMQFKKARSGSSAVNETVTVSAPAGTAEAAKEETAAQASTAKEAAEKEAGKDQEKGSEEKAEDKSEEAKDKAE